MKPSDRGRLYQRPSTYFFNQAAEYLDAARRLRAVLRTDDTPPWSDPKFRSAVWLARASNHAALWLRRHGK